MLPFTVRDSSSGEGGQDIFQPKPIIRIKAKFDNLDATEEYFLNFKRNDIFHVFYV
jgi:hypothetical protein